MLEIKSYMLINLEFLFGAFLNKSSIFISPILLFTYFKNIN